MFTRAMFHWPSGMEARSNSYRSEINSFWLSYNLCVGVHVWLTILYKENVYEQPDRISGNYNQLYITYSHVTVP